LIAFKSNATVFALININRHQAPQNHKALIESIDFRLYLGRDGMARLV